MRFYTADLHLGHANIREYCPARLALGNDVDAMNRELIDRWNETVGPHDIVTIVGDRFEELRPERRGRILLHGHVHDAYKIRGDMINVGVDAWDYRPVSDDQLAYWVQQITNSRFDVHVPPD